MYDTFDTRIEASLEDKIEYSDLSHKPQATTDITYMQIPDSELWKLRKKFWI